MKLSPYCVLLALLIAAPGAQAYDFGGAIKDAVKKNIDERTGATDNTTAEPKKADAAANNGGSEDSGGSEGSLPLNLSNPTTAEEVALGREITGNLLGAAPLVKDDALQTYVNKVGRWVASQGERADLSWHFGVIDSEDLNAFAAPGGFVLITKGLYRKLENEAQLAGVLGHEIGHVIKKHHLRVLQKSQLLNMGANLLGSKLGKDNQTVQKVIGNGAEILSRGLDKDAEYEADRIGLVLAIRAGYEPYGLTDVLQTISQTAKNDSSVELLYKTHPSPDDRLARLADATGSRLDKLKSGKVLEQRLYKLK